MYSETIEDYSTVNVTFNSEGSLLLFEYNPFTLTWYPDQILPGILSAHNTLYYSTLQLQIEAYFYNRHIGKWELFETHKNIVDNTGTIKIHAFPIAPKGIMDPIVPVAFHIIINNSTSELPDFIRSIIDTAKIGIWSHPVYMVTDSHYKAPELCKECHANTTNSINMAMHKACPCRVEQARLQISDYTEMKNVFEHRLKEFLHKESATCFQLMSGYGI